MKMICRTMIEKLSQILKKLDGYSSGDGNLQNVKGLLERLCSVFFKEQQLEDIVQRFKGFIHYFEEKWETIMGKISVQNSFISNPNRYF